MLSSKAASLKEYLEEMGPEKADIVSRLVEEITPSIDDSFHECINWGMITWEVPLSVYPNTYNKKPLMYCGLAALKKHYSIYMMGCYGDSEALGIVEKGFQEKGLKLDIGKCCLRFKKLENLDLDSIKESLSMYSAESWIQHYESCRGIS
ncbi:MAG: DUF1801 domain-containing protein [Verrucomicrobiota bacterium]